MDYYFKYLDKYSNEQYRYRLIVKFKEVPSIDKTLVAIQLNPSYASLERSDPTAGKVESWAYKNKFEKILFLNLFAIITPKFSEFRNESIDILKGVYNDIILRKAFNKYEIIVAAWGSTCYNDNKDLFKKRILQIKNLLAGKKMYRVGELSNGLHPRHGLVWNNDPQISSFDFDKYVELIS